LRSYVKVVALVSIEALSRSWVREYTISNIFTGILCTFGGTLVSLALLKANALAIGIQIAISTKISQLKK
jgi:hypothetical protein